MSIPKCFHLQVPSNQSCLDKLFIFSIESMEKILFQNHNFELTGLFD